MDASRHTYVDTLHDSDPADVLGAAVCANCGTESPRWCRDDSCSACCFDRRIAADYPPMRGGWRLAMQMLAQHDAEQARKAAESCGSR